MPMLDCRRLLAPIVFLFGFCAASNAVADGPIKLDKDAGFTMTDPSGDDDGPGTYKYPTDAVYKRGSFDITEFQVVPGASTTEFRVKVNAKI
jgi:carbohydrate-binding DOMON domain-containing protein